MYHLGNQKTSVGQQGCPLCLNSINPILNAMLVRCFNSLNHSIWQIYVEIERARLTKTLANIKEQNGDVNEAAAILQELQVSISSTRVNQD